jgi:hypothetical protein
MQGSGRAHKASDWTLPDQGLGRSSLREQQSLLLCANLDVVRRPFCGRDHISGGKRMPKVKIEVYEDGVPSATISVPIWLVKGAANLLPQTARQRLEQHVELEQIAELLRNPATSGKLIEVEDHNGGDRVIISIVDDDTK